MEPSDRDLLRRLASGDRESLVPLMARHYRRLYRIALSYLRDPDEALDAVQEAFVKAWAAAPRWDGRAEPGAWLTRIAVNEAIDRYRRARRRRASFEPLGIDVAAAEDGPDEALAGREAAERIGAAVIALPERQRAVFLLRHRDDMTLAEIGRALGLRLGTVKSTLHRAVVRLRARLEGLR